ncbi:MAG: hypothetical protein ACM3L8_00105 [Verrucomicrobiota bacterium]
MPRRHIRKVAMLFAASIALAVLAAGCGGGGGGGGETSANTTPVAPSTPVSVLTWDPPLIYKDSSPMDPYRDLDHYEVYVRQDANFTSDDLPVATIAAASDPPPGTINPSGKILGKEFVLDQLAPYIPPGNQHFVSLKAVGVDGQKSDFMPAVLWSKI